VNELLEDLQGLVDIAIPDDQHYEEACRLIEEVRKQFERVGEHSGRRVTFV
jgi:hypothetical protein